VGDALLRDAHGWIIAIIGEVDTPSVSAVATAYLVVATPARARRQPEAPETSAREIAEALDTYEREQAGTAATPQS